MWVIRAKAQRKGLTLLANRASHPQEAARELHGIFWTLQPGSQRVLKALEPEEQPQKQRMTHPVFNRNSFSQDKKIH